MISPADCSPSYKSTRAKSDGAINRAALSRQEAIHDTGLVQRFNAGDDSAFIEIASRYRDRMFVVAFGLLKNRADAEEIAQDTLIRAHRGLARFRGDSSLATWLHRIALNLARNRYWYFFRRQRHATVSLDRAFSDENQATFADLVASDEAGPARTAATHEFTELIGVCMQRLGSPQREILTLRNALNRSYAEIAVELSINVGTVKSRIARARENLRTLLAEACPEFGLEAQPTAWFDAVRPAGGVEVICA
jgi:RNA polymerase sigma-70 factor (ECF subfamily)